MVRAKTFIRLAFVVIVGFIGLKSYHYFFSASVPTIAVKGIENGGYYAGTIQCTLSGSDAYKVADISIWLDNAPLVNKYRVNRKEFEHQCAINSQPLALGKHTLRVEATSGSYHRGKTVQEYIFDVDNTPLQAAFVRSGSDKVFQGRTLHVQFQVNKDIQSAQVKTLSQTFDAVPESKHSPVYEAFIPIDCEENPNEYLLSVDIKDRVGNIQVLENKFQIMPYPFKRQTLTIDAEFVKTEAEKGLEQKLLLEELMKITQQSPKEKRWHGAFCVPTDMTVLTCDFGTIRTTKEKGRYMHKAVDLGARKKSVVWAAQDGIVVVKDRYARSGNTVVVDHGCGVLSLYCHLDSFANITVGERVDKGNPLGVMGKTGFATGEHLHWELLVNNIQVDPMQWVKPNF